MVDIKKWRELIEKSEANPSDDWKKTVISNEELTELLDTLKAAQEDAARDKMDAECFRWWVHEAANAPVGLAKAIMHCLTEDEYREVICGAMAAKNKAIDAARKSR